MALVRAIPSPYRAAKQNLLCLRLFSGQHPDIAPRLLQKRQYAVVGRWTPGMQYHLSRAHSESFLAMKVPIMLCGILVKRVLLVVFMFISIISRTWVAIWAQSK